MTKLKNLSIKNFDEKKIEMIIDYPLKKIYNLKVVKLKKKLN
jgi:hypothetical protein